MQANTIIKAALRKLVIVPSGGTPTANQYADGLEVLNDIIKLWSAQNNLIYEDTIDDLTIPIGTQSITIGASGDLIYGRPVEVMSANLIEGSQEYIVTPIDEPEYRRIGNKELVYRPNRLYYRDTYPNGTIYFDSTSDKEYTMSLTSLKELTQFPDGTTEVSMPDFYETALKANLTVELAPEMGAGKRVTPLMVRSADDSKKVVVGRSVDIRPSTIELTAKRRYNIEKDE